MRVFAVLSAFLLAMLCAASAHAEARLKNKPQLILAISSVPPCCVIDARSAASRQREPLANSLPWRTDLKIKPTAVVIVLADQDQDALAIGNILSARHPGKTILAVKGGVATWKAVNLALLNGTGMEAAMGGAVNFVIPSNTCEQGKPLQELRPNSK